MNYIPFICAGLLLALFLVTKLLGGKSLNRIKARTVGHGQHGSARWATHREIKSYYTMVPYEPQKWRTQPELRPTQPGFVLGSFQHGRHGKKITAWVDAGDSHAMMIASPGGGKTAYFLYPNIEYAMACGISFVTLDTKGDLYRNMATIGEKYYGYHTVVYDFRKPMESDTYNLMSLVNKYMDQYRNTGSVDDKARAEKQARMVAKSIITGGVDMANMGANSFFYEASESLLTSAIMILSEFGDPETRHISSAHKMIDAVSVREEKGKPNLYSKLLSALPPYHKAAMLASSAVNSAEQTTASIVSTAHSRLNELIDSELEQMICFDTKFQVEEFIEHPTGVYIVLPEEDTTKYFIVSLVIQQINAELTAMADRLGGTLPKKVICFYDELGTIPKIRGLGCHLYRQPEPEHDHCRHSAGHQPVERPLWQGCRGNHVQQLPRHDCRRIRPAFAGCGVHLKATRQPNCANRIRHDGWQDRRAEPIGADDGSPADGTERAPGNAKGRVCPPEDILQVRKNENAAVHELGDYFGREVSRAGTSDTGD